MVVIDDVVVHDEVLKAPFVCNLMACKGACCVEGDGGAPLTMEEAGLLEDHLDEIAPFMAPKGLATAQAEGVYYLDDLDRELATQLVDGRECVFAHYEEGGILKCAVEDAYNAGAISFQKPISCHLYPIRVVQRGAFEHVVYHEWEICAPACANGKSLGVPLYSFLKAPLIRKYGEDWYAGLEYAALNP